jgi:hypothetical protein
MCDNRFLSAMQAAAARRRIIRQASGWRITPIPRDGKVDGEGRRQEPCGGTDEAFVS